MKLYKDILTFDINMKFLTIYLKKIIYSLIYYSMKLRKIENLLKIFNFMFTYYIERGELKLF